MTRTPVAGLPLATILAVVVLGTVFSTGCGTNGDDAGSDSPPPVAKETYATWDEFLRSAPAGEAGRHPVVFIGIDAGVWSIIDRLIDDGRLPNFERIKREGAYGPLRSVRSYVTPPAWTSMFTGYLPSHTGVYTFGYWDRDARQFISSNSDDILVPSVWEAASRAGLKVGVFNVPMTYPPRPVNGAMVTGQMTPIEVENAAQLRAAPEDVSRYLRLSSGAPGATDYSPPIGTVLRDSLNAYVIRMQDTLDDGRNEFDTTALTIMSTGDSGRPPRVLSTGAFPIGSFSPWMKLRYRLGTEIVPAFTRLRVERIPNDFRIEVSETARPIDATFTYPESLADELKERFGYYLPTKFLSREIVPTLTEDMAQYASFFYDYDDWDLFCFVFTQTDNIQHIAGFGETTARVYQTIDRLVGEVMDRMPEGATLIVGSDHGAKEYDYGIDMNQLLHGLGLLEYASPTQIDYAKTLVFHNLWHLYLNRDLITRDELARRGFHLPATADPVEWLIDKLRETKVRNSSGRGTFVIKAEPIPPDAAGRAPDMVILGSNDDYIVEFWNIMKPHNRVVWELKGSERFWHQRDGVYMVWGDGVRAGVDAGSQDIENIAPTILYMLGLPVGGDMDGHVMADVFEPGALSKRPIRALRGYRDIPREVILPDAGRETLRKKLRSLGYIQ